MEWLSPTGHVDSQWFYESRSYDNNLETFAYSSDLQNYPTWSDFLVLTHESMTCEKVRFWLYIGGTPLPDTIVDIDVYYDGEWHDVYEGVCTRGDWFEKSLSSSQTITSIRLRVTDDVEVNGEVGHYPRILEVELYGEVISVSTEAASQVGIDHAKGNGTATGTNITERGFEVKLEFLGTLQQGIDHGIAGFLGTYTYSILGWEGTLTKTITETGVFAAGAFVGDLGRFPIATFNDKLFPAESYTYRARATIGGVMYYGGWVAFTTASYPAGEELPDDVISPEVPITEPVEEEPYSPFPPEEEEELPPFVWPELVFPPWEYPPVDIPPLGIDPSIIFGKTFGVFLRGLDRKEDWKTLREKCIIYQENMNQFALTVNHNTLVLKNLVNDIIEYVDGDVYPSDLRLMDSSQHLTPLYQEEISPDGFKDIINDFRFKDIYNVYNLSTNFGKVLNSLNSLYEGDYRIEPISYDTMEYMDIQPTAKRMILQLGDMDDKFKEVRRLIISNFKRIFSYV